MFVTSTITCYIQRRFFFNQLIYLYSISVTDKKLNGMLKGDILSVNLTISSQEFDIIKFQFEIKILVASLNVTIELIC